MLSYNYEITNIISNTFGEIFVNNNGAFILLKHKKIILNNQKIHKIIEKNNLLILSDLIFNF